MKIFKSLILLIPVLFLASSFTPPMKGFPYKTNEGKFSVVFPGDFSTERTEGDKNVTIKTSCTFNDQTYFAAYTLHEVEITDHQDMADVSLDSFKETLKAEQISKTEWDIKKDKGLKAMLYLPNEQVSMEYRVILIGNIQYQFIVMAAKSLYDEKGAEAFFNSIKMMK